MVGVGDPVARGFVASMSRPGGNITGSSDTLPNAAELRFELLKEAIPSLSRVAFIHNSAVTPTAAVEEAAHHLGLILLPLEARGPVDIDLALRSVRRHRPDAVVVVPNPLTFARDTGSPGWGSSTGAGRFRLARVHGCRRLHGLWREHGHPLPPRRGRWTRSSRERGRASCPSRSRASSS